MKSRQINVLSVPENPSRWPCLKIRAGKSGPENQATYKRNREKKLKKEIYKTNILKELCAVFKNHIQNNSEEKTK